MTRMDDSSWPRRNPSPEKDFSLNILAVSAIERGIPDLATPRIALEPRPTNSHFHPFLSHPQTQQSQTKRDPSGPLCLALLATNWSCHRHDRLYCLVTDFILSDQRKEALLGLFAEYYWQQANNVIVITDFITS
ncbi:hypothetical protein CV_0678 [Chromobacterium violaceum ATCC 12472]|uniref:Uncharacterized protein n=1 Tax=Chromobacterium violaceum (strain ATCC 12472 / DSM 30191 / JCM 1249 / CCUG 213 / NBRC 12614 / NCIMB 9131 / NCTC 9757 / MK) TaxID=243365 RepID=Q7P090_CHRVO|nr:hypothetical protein CV_0678 [Chromobacterium violaceum ATCC 12472]